MKHFNVFLHHHTPTSFPVQPPADKMHEYLTVKAFSPNILLLQMWPMRLSPWRMHLHQPAIINLSPDTTTKYQTLCSTLPLPKPLTNTILSQLHLPLSLKSYFPNIQLKHESPNSGPW